MTTVAYCEKCGKRRFAERACDSFLCKPVLNADQYSALLELSDNEYITANAASIKSAIGLESLRDLVRWILDVDLRARTQP